MQQALALAWLVGIALMGHTELLLPQLSLPIAFIVFIIVIIQIYLQGLWPQPIFRMVNALTAALLIVVVGYSYGQHQLQQRLILRETHVKPSQVIVYVDRLNQTHARSVTQQVKVFNVQPQPVNWLTSIAISEHTHTAKIPALQLGEYYRLTGQVRPAHGYATPGAFDQEKWYIQQNIMAFFRVEHVEKLSRTEISALGYRPTFTEKLRVYVDKKRLAVREYLQQQPLAHQGLLLGLLTGDRSALDEKTESEFQRLGMSHLLAISGPHVLIFAAMVCFMLQWLLRRYRPTLYLKFPKPYVLMLPFLLCVAIYTACVGFEIPALRTLLICTITALFILLRQSVQPLKLLLYSAAILLVFDPFSVLSAAFWLSYGACLILLRIYQTLQRQDQRIVDRHQRIVHQLKLFIESQWKIFIALLPLMVIFFKQIAWISPITNLIAIPYLGLIVVPLDIVAGIAWLIFEPLGGLLWQLNDHLLGLFLGGLALLDQAVNPTLVPWALNTWQLLALILSLVLLFLPRGVLPKTWAFVALLPLFFYQHSRQGFELHVLDVGQGQAILIRDQDQSMMIDVGGSMDESRFSVGEQIIFPFLMRQGIQHLDQLILTHLDQDHSGAYPALKPKIAIQKLMSNERLVDDAQPFEYCYGGKTWQWHRVKFEVLSPPQSVLQAAHDAKNETSCVLYITYLDTKQPQHFLIMGDAGWPTEHQLLNAYPHLKVDVLILGHHGSKHSSAYGFLAHYRPKITIASAGFANRYGHPSKELQARLDALKIPLLSTQDQGTVRFTMHQQQMWVLGERQRWLWLQRAGLQPAVKLQPLVDYKYWPKQDSP